MPGTGPQEAPAAAGRVTLRAEAVDWREIDGEVVALARKDSTYLSVNRVGTALWPALARGATVDELVEILLERFEVEPARARADVEAFLRHLSERGLIDG